MSCSAIRVCESGGRRRGAGGGDRWGKKGNVGWRVLVPRIGHPGESLRQPAAGGFALVGGLGAAKDLTLLQENLDGRSGAQTGQILFAFHLELLLKQLLPDRVPDLG